MLIAKVKPNPMIQTIYVESKIESHPRVRQMLARYSGVEIILCDHYGEIFNPKSQNFRLQKQNPALILAHKYENHVLAAPPGYGVGSESNYYFSHMLNCIYDCRYCFLQGMYQSAHYVVFVNYEDITDSIITHSSQLKNQSPWFFSGYDCDSLAFEPVTGFMQHCLRVFEDIPHAWLEIRTKSTQVRTLLGRPAMDNVVVAFSFTPADFSTRFEHGVPDIHKRIKAMQLLQSKGWQIGLRFDPIIAYHNYQSSYKDLFEMIFSSLDHALIHSVSMGEFRMPKGFFKKIKKLYPQEPLYHLHMDDNNGMTSFNCSVEQSMFGYCRSQLLRWMPEAKLFNCSI